MINENVFFSINKRRCSIYYAAQSLHKMIENARKILIIEKVWMMKFKGAGLEQWTKRNAWEYVDNTLVLHCHHVPIFHWWQSFLFPAIFRNQSTSILYIMLMWNMICKVQARVTTEKNSQNWIIFTYESL